MFRALSLAPMNLRWKLSALVAAAAVTFGACRDNNTDDCPSVFTDQAGRGLVCSSPDLQCPVQVALAACEEGVAASALPTSCTCTRSEGSNADPTWLCADPAPDCPDASEAAGDASADSPTDSQPDVAAPDANTE